MQRMRMLLRTLSVVSFFSMATLALSLPAHAGGVHASIGLPLPVPVFVAPRARLPTTACRVSRARRRGTRVLRVPSCVLATSLPSPRILWVPSWVLATPPPSPPPLAPLVMMGRTAAHDASVA